MKTIAVLGAGYVGLVTAAGLAETGNRVYCVDIDETRIASLRKGTIPFFEPGLSELVARNVAAHRLSFSNLLSTHCDIYIIAVGTPPAPDGNADISAVLLAAGAVASVVTKSTVLAIKSTVPVGTGDMVAREVATATEHRITVVSTPEFLKEGAALEDFFRPDRVILGVTDAATEATLRELYRPLQLSSDRVLVMDRRSAELAKYAANAMLAIRVSFMNELARFCDQTGADIGSVRRAIGSDRRIGPHFLHAGPGYGGSCFPKDVAALSAMARNLGTQLRLVTAAADVNERQGDYVLLKILSLLPGLSRKVVAVWGLAFKAETDDVRESPAGPLVQELIRRGATVHAYDPKASPNFARMYAPNAVYFDNEYHAVEGADMLVLMTEWRHLRAPDLYTLRTQMRTPKIVDTRNIWTAFDLNKHGFEYVGIGTAAGRPGGPSHEQGT